MILLLLMLSLLSGGSTKVVQDFETECGEFFYYRVAPTVLYEPWYPQRYRQICQTLNNKQYFATLYDTYNRIPVYSAYVFEGLKDCKRKSKWYFEPQLDYNNAGKNMEPERSIDLFNQASKKDYVNSRYDRGHLAPVYHADSQGCSDATFTLTNAAPQYSSFNRGQWKKIEYNIASTVRSRCIDSTAFIVTGVVPGNNAINNRVTVPSHFWTAYCCTDLKANTLISGGAIGENSGNVPPDEISVEDLQDRLIKLYKVQSFSLFHYDCKRRGINTIQFFRLSSRLGIRHSYF